MASPLPSQALHRAQIHVKSSTHQIRHASLLRRPHRPYTFTQLITLSDGSTYTHRTTSPLPVFRSTKDTRNSPLWQPSLSSLRNIEQDEAGRLRAFRERFGRGWDLDADLEGGEVEGNVGKGAEEIVVEEKEESLMDLISGSAYGRTGGGQGPRASEQTEKEVEMIMVRREGVLVKVPKKEDKPKGSGKKK